MLSLGFACMNIQFHQKRKDCEGTSYRYLLQITSDSKSKPKPNKDKEQRRHGSCSHKTNSRRINRGSVKKFRTVSNKLTTSLE